jgi:hypothetical protein
MEDWVGGACGTIGEKRNAYSVLVVKHEGNNPLGRPTRKWEYQITMDHEGIGWDVDWINLAQNKDKWWALVNTVVIFVVL